MKIKHIVSCLFVSLIGFSACSIEELPYNQLTEDELDGSYESLLSATRGNYAVFKKPLSTRDGTMQANWPVTTCH